MDSSRTRPPRTAGGGARFHGADYSGNTRESDPQASAPRRTSLGAVLTHSSHLPASGLWFYSGAEGISPHTRPDLEETASECAESGRLVDRLDPPVREVLSAESGGGGTCNRADGVGALPTAHGLDDSPLDRVGSQSEVQPNLERVGHVARRREVRPEVCLRRTIARDLVNCIVGTVEFVWCIAPEFECGPKRVLIAANQTRDSPVEECTSPRTARGGVSDRRGLAADAGEFDRRVPEGGPVFSYVVPRPTVWRIY